MYDFEEMITFDGVLMSKYTLAQISFFNKKLSPYLFCKEMSLAGLLSKDKEEEVKKKLKDIESLSGGRLDVLELFDYFSRHDPELLNALEIVVHNVVSRNFS